MNPKLTLPYPELEKSYKDYIEEWESSEKDIIPTASDRRGMTFREALESWALEQTEEIRKIDLVPATLYFLIDENERILGAIHFRHELNEYLFKLGGNIGYGVRPSERQKGYASLMLKLILKKCREKGLSKVLVTCIKDNIPSAKTIEANGGVFEGIVHVNNKDMRRYWIKL